MSQEFIDELVAMPSAELGELLRQTELERRDAEQRLTLIAGVVEQKSQFLTDGHTSMSAYLKAQINCSGATANRIRRRGRLLDHHAEALDATSHGRVSVDNIDLLAKAVAHPRVGDRVAEFVPTLVDHAEHFPVADFSVLVDRVVANADSDGATPDDPLRSDATVAAGPDGVYVKVVGGTGLQAADMKAVFERACEAEFERDVEERRARYGHAASEHPLPRSANQRRFAAQYAIHLAWASTPPGAQPPEAIVNILYTAGRAARSLADHGLVTDTDTDTDTEVFTSPADGLCAERPDDLLAARCETSTGVPISEHDALRAMLRGQVRRAVVDSASVVIDLGGRRRLFTGTAREAAQLVAHRCSHPGCSIPAEFCQVDHLERHVDGGPTDQRNAGPACARHNLYKERSGLRSRRAANGRIHLIRHDGSVMLPVGARPPTWADPDPPGPSEPPSPSDISERSDPPATTADTGCSGFETITWSEFLARDLIAGDPGAFPVVRIDFAEVSSILDSS